VEADVATEHHQLRMKVTTHYVHIGDGTVVEFVTTYAGDDTTIWVNVLPPADPPVEPPVAALEPVLEAPVPAETQCAAASPARLAPAASSGFKAGLASFGGMLAAGLLYVQENFGSITDISLKNVILIAAGAVISGLLYFFYRWYKPHTP
jgi:hypothetical protein